MAKRACEPAGSMALEAKRWKVKYEMYKKWIIEHDRECQTVSWLDCETELDRGTRYSIMSMLPNWNAESAPGTRLVLLGGETTVTKWLGWTVFIVDNCVEHLHCCIIWCNTVCVLTCKILYNAFWFPPEAAWLSNQYIKWQKKIEFAQTNCLSNNYFLFQPLQYLLWVGISN